MKIVEVRGKAGNSKIIIGEKLGNLGNYIPDGPPIIITDKHVWELYKSDFPDAEVIQIGTGEKKKNLDTVQKLYRRLVDIGADRASFIVGIGGGIVCDIAGFVASTYMRGVRFGFVSSTLLAQVDASTGGKNGVNFLGYKNIVGVFNQPEFVLCDPDLLRTLPEKEIACGYAEIVKHAAISSKSMFSYLEDHYADALQLDPGVIETLVYDSIIIKSDIVNRDETEKGERRKLNFGHTFGHAIEKIAYLKHGESISIGMVMASDLSVMKGLLDQSDADRIRSLLDRLNLPTQMQVDKRKILNAIQKDKKKEKDRVFFVLIHGIGKAVIEPMSFEELAVVFHRIGS